MSKLISLLEQQINDSDTSDTEVGKQRSRNHRYYNMRPLGNEQKGRSHYIDPAVFGSVEDKKAVFSETFLGSRQVVRFNGANGMESEAKTAYVQQVLRATVDVVDRRLERVKAQVVIQRHVVGGRR